jgi:8-oxo-dGTP diphosphatase
MTVAAARELMGETGCTARSFDFFGAVNDDTVKTNHYIQFGFLANNLNAEPKNLEPEFCEGWQWFDLKALPNPIISSEIGLVRLFLENKHFSDTP